MIVAKHEDKKKTLCNKNREKKTVAKKCIPGNQVQLRLKEAEKCRLILMENIMQQNICKVKEIG